MLTSEEIIENLNQLFDLEQFDVAEQVIASAKAISQLYNDIVAIYDANLCLRKGNYEQMWLAIQKGFSINCKNHELYLLLGEYYLTKNPNQAYLCFENALFYCTEESDALFIQEYIKRLKGEYDITVRNTSFIILSYNLLEDTRNCIKSIRETVPKSACEIVVIDNASEDGSVEWLREQKDIVLRENKENAGFPKGCNQGIEVASKENDIFLLNNDTILTPNALFWLRMGLYEDDTYGSVGSVSNHVSNSQNVDIPNPTMENLLQFGVQNNIPQKYPYEQKIYLVGFALLIKREVYEKVGDLDECFSPGNYEDNDYGLRIMQEGYKNILCRNSFIIHLGSKSFGKYFEQQADKYKNLLKINCEKFKTKWGFDPEYYLYSRMELIDLIQEEKEATLNILDIGCACGAGLACIKGKYPHANIYGVEIVSKVASIAKSVTDVICGDIEQMEFPWPENFFDYIIMGDVLEHLHEPSIVLKKLYQHVKQNGHIIVSIPNMKHYSVMLPLIIRDEFTYSDAGILDTTHLKMYTEVEIRKLLSNAKYQIEGFYYAIQGEPEEAIDKIIDLLVSLSVSKDKTKYLAYQYIVKAKKSER